MRSLKPGDKVYYNPPYGPKENGIVKEVRNEIAFVVFKCANDWDNYKDYTGQSTLICDLELGWHDKSKLSKEIKREIALMLIPFIGIVWILNRIIPNMKSLSWWNYSDNGFITITAVTFYQILCFYILKLII